MADTSVIFVNWNSKAYIRQSLASLLAVHPLDDLEIIVVDSGSFDGCREMLAADYPAVIYIQSDENVGFSQANNLGIRRATGRRLMFLNPDTEFISDSISVLCRHLDSIPDAGAVGCRLLNADRSFQASCVQSFPTVLNQIFDSDFLRARLPHSRLWGVTTQVAAQTKPMEVEAISGACILAKRECIAQIGGFSESYFMYGEDIDLCLRIHLSGRKVYYIPNTSLVHFGGGSTRQAASTFSTVMMRESVYRLMRFSRGRPAALAYRISMAVNAVVRLVLIGPMLLFGGRVVRHGGGSMRKWAAVLRWSLSLPPRVWIRQGKLAQRASA